MPAPYVDRFLQSIEKESNSWMTWQSVEPLSDEESHRILKDPVLSKRILKSRACYPDKACGNGELCPKCRVVALGHLDPDLKSLSRNAATPGRVSEQLVYLFIMPGPLGQGMQLQPFYKANKKKDRCLYTYRLQEMD